MYNCKFSGLHRVCRRKRLWRPFGGPPDLTQSGTRSCTALCQRIAFRRLENSPRRPPSVRVKRGLAAMRRCPGCCPLAPAVACRPTSRRPPCSSWDTRRPPNSSPRRPLLEFSVLAEQVGFDFGVHQRPFPALEAHRRPRALCAGLARRAGRVAPAAIVMGTSVLTPTFRYHPSIVAQAFGTLGSMFPGRVILGVGTGEWLNEVPSTGMVWPETKERFARLREAVTLIRKLWSEDSRDASRASTTRPRMRRSTTSRRAGADLRRRRRAAGREICRPHGRRLHLHLAARRGSCTPRRCCRMSRKA